MAFETYQNPKESDFKLLRHGFEYEYYDLKARVYEQMLTETQDQISLTCSQTIEAHKQIAEKVFTTINGSDYVIFPGVFSPLIGPSGVVVQEWIDQSDEYFENKVVLDVGCGSGIPTCQFALLGARQVFATEISPIAISNTLANIELNGLQGRVEIVANYQNVGADIIFANLPPHNKSPGNDIEKAFYELGLTSILQLLDHFAKSKTSQNSEIILPIFDINLSWLKSELRALGLKCKIILTKNSQ
jgi:SAM-dependent methyltransferase